MRVHVMILVGPPGSGKSRYARALAQAGAVSCEFPKNAHFVVSADHYFYDENGVYQFAASALGAAHAACMRTFVENLQFAVKATAYESITIVVDNTNTTTVEIAPYYAVAKAYGASVELVKFDAHPRACALRNVHGVSEPVVHAAHLRAYGLEPLPFWEVTLTKILDRESYDAHPGALYATIASEVAS